ncbi:MAG: TetR/AcrR family transcriptional regulator, partial [Planctomycetota bacterium]
RLALFDAAATLPGNSRRRMMAIGLACEFYVDQFPDDFAIERLVRNDHVVSKSSPQRRELLGSCESRCMLIVAGIVRDAVAAGDLQLPNDVCADTQSSRVKKTSIGAEDFVFGLWSLMYGSQLIEATSPSLSAVGITRPRVTIRRDCNAMLDGFHWQPLYEPATYQKQTRETLQHFESMIEQLRQDGENQQLS